MAFYAIEKTRLQDILGNLMKGFTLIAPVERGSLTSFEQVLSPREVILTAKNTDRPPKSSLFPQKEVIFSYEGGEIKKEESAAKRILFCVRPCDAKSFGLLDGVFCEGEFTDNYYKQRRNKTIVFAMACNEPGLTCFCTSFGLGPFSKENADVFLVDIGKVFLAESITEQGEAILSKQGLSNAPDEDVSKIDELRQKAESAISSGLDISGLRDKLSNSFEDPIWEELHLKCLGCGICTFLCPTCHCFDIVDEGDAQSGERIRIWDSCIFPLFTLHASGHQPRETGRERMRQRIMHKFNYFPEKFGEAACVGCGRCIVNCPVNLDIREVIHRLHR